MNNIILNDSFVSFLTRYGGGIKAALVITLCVLFFLILYRFAAAAIRDRYRYMKEKVGTGVLDYMKNSKWNGFNYDYLQKFLDSVGATYYSKGKITPLTYMTYRLLSLIAGFIIGVRITPAAGLILAAAACFMPETVMKLRNERDNHEMLQDIMCIYDVVFLQTSSGTYISQILIDAYMVVENARLKGALLELTGRIKETNDIAASLEVFNSRFDNEHLWNLTTAIRQSVENGNSVQMLTDIRKYMASLQKSYNEQEKDRISRRNNIFKIALFIGIIAILFYGCFVGLIGSASGLGL